MRRKVALAAMVMLAGCETMPLPGYEPFTCNQNPIMNPAGCPMKTVHHKLGVLWQQAMRGPTDQRGWTVHLDPLSHRDLQCDPEPRHGGDLDMVWRDENRGAGRWRGLPITLHRAMLPLPPVSNRADIGLDMATIDMTPPKLISIRLTLRHGRHHWLDDAENHPCWTDLK